MKLTIYGKLKNALLHQGPIWLEKSRAAQFSTNHDLPTQFKIMFTICLTILLPTLRSPMVVTMSCSSIPKSFCQISEDWFGIMVPIRNSFG
ncbi:MAG: hypothetical protein COB90_09385 [Hyphomicrobiales bacterium]|nr:MAG: hypothetical protein COB90_09385 [Hyphomicrobiales bacterium]